MRAYIIVYTEALKGDRYGGVGVGGCCPHRTDGDIANQKGEVICPRTHDLKIVEREKCKPRNI